MAIGFAGYHFVFVGSHFVFGILHHYILQYNAIYDNTHIRIQMQTEMEMQMQRDTLHTTSQPCDTIRHHILQHHMIIHYDSRQ